MDHKLIPAADTSDTILDWSIVSARTFPGLVRKYLPGKSQGKPDIV